MEIPFEVNNETTVPTTVSPRTDDMQDVAIAPVLNSITFHTHAVTRATLNTDNNMSMLLDVVHPNDGNDDFGWNEIVLEEFSNDGRQYYGTRVNGGNSNGIRRYWGAKSQMIFCYCTHLPANAKVKIRFDNQLDTENLPQCYQDVLFGNYYGNYFNQVRLMYNMISNKLQTNQVEYRGVGRLDESIGWACSLLKFATEIAIPQAKDEMFLVMDRMEQRMEQRKEAYSTGYKNHVIKMGYNYVMESAGLKLLNVAQMMNQLTLNSIDDNRGDRRRVLRNIQFAKREEEHVKNGHNNNFDFRSNEPFRDKYGAVQEGSSKEVLGRLHYLHDKEFPCIESSVKGLLYNFEMIHHEVKVSYTSVDMEVHDDNGSDVNNYVEWSARQLWIEMSSNCLPLAIHYLLSVGSGLLSLSHIRDMDKDAWKMVMGGTRQGGRSGWRWNQVKSNTCAICGNKFEEEEHPDFFNGARAVNLPHAKNTFRF